MKIILLKDVRGVGRRHEVKDVADGYATNALFPKKLAESATPEKIRQLEAQKLEQEAQLRQEEERLVKKIELLRGTQVTIVSRATEKGGLFKAVTPKDVAKAILAEHSVDMPENIIQLPAPIKTTGEHAARLVHKDFKIDILVSVKAA